MAQTRGLFISENYVKENSEIDENVDMKLILPTIWYCQKEYLEKTLGTPLFEDLLAKVIAGTLAGNDLILVNQYISDALLMWVRMEIQIPLLYKFRNKSVAKNSAEFSQPIDYQEHKYLKDYYRSKAEYFSKRLDDYLCWSTSSNLYPLYTTYTQSDELRAQPTTATTSVFLGKRYPKHSGGRDMNNY
jgi:hypothetical protein